jgi:hypothetical protein
MVFVGYAYPALEQVSYQLTQVPNSLTQVVCPMFLPPRGGGVAFLSAYFKDLVDLSYAPVGEV